MKIFSFYQRSFYIVEKAEAISFQSKTHHEKCQLNVKLGNEENCSSYLRKLKLKSSLHRFPKSNAEIFEEMYSNLDIIFLKCSHFLSKNSLMLDNISEFRKSRNRKIWADLFNWNWGKLIQTLRFEKFRLWLFAFFNHWVIVCKLFKSYEQICTLLPNF